MQVLIRLTAELTDDNHADKIPAEIPLIVDIQDHVDFSSPPKSGEFYSGDVTYDKLFNNFSQFSSVGPVWIGEMTIRGGDRIQRTQILQTMIQAGLDSKAVDSFLFWELMKPNGYYANGDLLFDVNNNFAPTLTYYNLLKSLFGETK